MLSSGTEASKNHKVEKERRGSEIERGLMWPHSVMMGRQGPWKMKLWGKAAAHFGLYLSVTLLLSAAVHPCHPRIWEAEVGGQKLKGIFS